MSASGTPKLSSGSPSTLLSSKTNSPKLYGSTDTNGTVASPSQSEQPVVKRSVLLYSALLLVFAAGNSIFFKKMTNAMPNYPYFLSQITTVVYVPIFFAAVFWEMKFTNNITPEMTSFPKSKFLMMGVFDSISGVFMLFGGVHTAGSTQALLGNSTIPITMLLSVIFLKTRFKINHYLGATVIMAGVVVVILPQMLNSADSGQDNPLFNIIFLVSVVPGAFSSIYKQLIFGDVDIGANYLQAWVALFQCGIGLLLMPLNSLKFLGENYMPMDQIMNSMSNGAQCLLGINSVTENCWTDTPVPGQAACDDCGGAWVIIAVYLFFNCTYNVIIVLFVKYFGAAYLYAIMTLRLPILQLAFAMPFISNPPEPLRWEGGVGLALIVAGIVAYRWKSGQDEAGDGEADLILPYMGMAIRIPKLTKGPEAAIVGRDRDRIRRDFYGKVLQLQVRTPNTDRRNSAVPSPNVAARVAQAGGSARISRLPGAPPRPLSPNVAKVPQRRRSVPDGSTLV